MRSTSSWSRGSASSPRQVVIVAMVAAFYVFALAAPASAQSRSDRPDFRITKASFNGRDLHVEYVNATGVGYPRVRYEVGLQWYDAAGKPVGERHWLSVPEVERGGVSILDTAYRIDLTYRRSGGNYNRRLLDFILQRPNTAEELRVTVDDGDRVFETDESNNIASLRIPLPDLQITGAKFLSPNRLEISYRNANPSPIPIPFRIGFTWAEEGGAYANATRWINVLEPAAGATETVVLSRTDASYLTSQNRQAGDRLDWYFERRPGNATRMKITIDDAGTVREENEQNNLVTARPFLPDLVVRDAALDGNRLTFTYGNAGEGYIRDIASRVLFQWVGASGKPVGEPRWWRFAQMNPGQTFTVDADRFDVEYAIPGTSRTATQRLGAYVRQQPQDAARLTMTIDDEQRIIESDEQNNSVAVSPPPPPQSDLTITDAVLTADEFGFTVRNLGTGATPQGQPTSLWFEWVDATDARVGALAWADVRSAIGSGQTFRFSAGGAYERFTRFTRERTGGGTELLTLTEFLADAPEIASHLKVHADGPNAIRESNEANNIALLARPTVPRPDLRIADFTIDPITPRAGERVWFIVRVENVGSATTGMQTATGITVDLSKREANRTLIGQFTAPAIPPGKLFTHRWTKENYYGWVAVAGTHTIEVCADRAKVVSETDEINNCARKEVTVAATVDEQPKLPDLTIIDATLDTAALRFWMHNRGETATGPTISLWYEMVDAQGKRVGELRWINLNAAMQPRSKQQGNQLLEFATLDSERGTIALGAFVSGAPPSATHLKLTIDGPNTHAESNEQNNSVFLVLPTKPMPDLTFARTTLIADAPDPRIEYVLKNAGTANTTGGVLELQWLTADGKPTGPAHAFVTYGLLKSGDRATRGLLMQDSGPKPGQTGRYLLLPPKDATQIRMTLDPTNVIAESNEANNVVVFARPAVVPLSDLAITEAKLTTDTFAFTYQNVGTVRAGLGIPLSTWFEWVDADNRRVGELVWHDGETLPPKYRTQIEAETKVSSASRSNFPLREFLEKPPDGATHLSVSLDGPSALLEFNEANNVTRLVRQIVPLPDLRIALFSMDPDAPRAGERVWFIARVENVGRASTGTQTATGITIDLANSGTNRKLIGQFTAPAIPSGKFFTHRWTQENTYGWVAVAGTHTVEVCADRAHAVAEEDEINNCARKEVTVAATVDEQATLPDLLVEDVAVRDGALHVTARNAGRANAVATDAWFMWFAGGRALSSSAAVDLPAVAAGRSATIVVPFNAKTEASQILREPPKDGTRVRIFLDGSRKVAEVNENNNDAMLDRAKLPAPESPKQKEEPKKPEPVASKEADLRVEHITVTPASPMAGDALTFAVTVKNVGGTLAAESVAYLLVDLGNDDDPESAPDPIDAPSLDAGAAQVLTWRWEDRAVAGTHKVEACVDVADDIEEANDQNNCRSKIFTVRGSGATADGTSAFASTFHALRAVLGWRSK